MNHTLSNTLSPVADFFNRDTIARNMGNFLINASASSISPAILDGQWGSGKTTHALRIETYLNKHSNGVKCLYLDAFKSDHSNEPYGMILSALYSIAPKNMQYQMTELIKKKSFPYLRAFAKHAVAAIPVAGELLKAAIEAASDTKDVVKDYLESVQETEGKIEELRLLINRIACDREAIFIIDELDRCRPDFAVDLIEIIKHVFEQTRIKFLLVMNKDQLLESIKHRYGLNDTMAKVYLDKFIRHEFSMSVILPTSELQQSTDVVYEYFYELIKEKQLELFVQKSQYVAQVVKSLLDARSIQLREVERWVKNIELLSIKAKEIHPNSFMGEIFSLKEYIHRATALVFAAYVNAFCSKTRDGILRSRYHDKYWLSDIPHRFESVIGMPELCKSALKILQSNSKSITVFHILNSLDYGKSGIMSPSVESVDALRDIYIYVCYLNCVM